MARIGVSKGSIQILIWMCIFKAALTLQLDEVDQNLLDGKKKAIAEVLFPTTTNAHTTSNFQSAIASANLTTLVTILKSVAQALQQSVISSDITQECLSKVEDLLVDRAAQAQQQANNMLLQMLLG